MADKEPRPAPCPLCGAPLKRKVTLRNEVVFDHPRNLCLLEWKRVRSYAVADWNRSAEIYAENCKKLQMPRQVADK